MSSYVHIDNKNKDILLLVESSTQRLDDTALTAEAIYPISFTQPKKRSVLSLHYNGNNSFLFVNATNIYQFKAKKLWDKIIYTICRYISKDVTINNMKKQD